MSRKLKILIIVVVVLIAWTLLAPRLGAHLIVEKPLREADAIVVLSGSAVYKERVQKAAELYREGVAPIVLVTDDGGRGAWSLADGMNLPYVELERRELLANGVPPDLIVTLPGVVSGTDDEARAVAAEVESRRMRSLLVVTSAYHTRRALNTFEKTLADKNIKVGMVHPPVNTRTFNPNYWWLSTIGWQTVAGEYAKSAVYYFY